MVMEKFEKFFCVFIHMWKKMYLQQLKLDMCGEGVGTIFQWKAYERVHLLWKVKGLDIWADPPTVKICWVPFPPPPSWLLTLYTTQLRIQNTSSMHRYACRFFRQFHGTSKLTILYATLNHYYFTIYNRRHIVRKKQEKKTFCKMFFFQKK